MAVLMIDDNDFQEVYTEAFSSSTSTPYPFDLDGKKVTFTPLGASSRER